MNTDYAKPLYQIIIEDIQNTIAEGNIDYDMPFCTEKSICEKYNVSRITAKHAIKELEHSGVLHRKRGVGSFVARPEKVKERHAGIQKEAPYKVIALIIPFSITKGGIFKAIEAASNILSLSNYYFTFHICEPNPKSEEAILTLLYAQNVDGIVFYPSSTTLPHTILKQFVEKKKPVIILDKPHDYPYISSIVCDNFTGNYILTEHLVSYGHTNICYLSRFTCDELSSVRDRYAGYAQCLKDNHIDTPPKFIHLDTESQSRYPLLKHIINSLHLEGITAVECENDEVAFNVYMCCRSLSIRVPEEMNITGFDNIDWAVTGSAQITTIDQNFAKIGETIAGIILQDEYTPKHFVIPVKLIPRVSTGKIMK